MQYPTWRQFNAKYPSEQLQRDRFEDLARCIFRLRYGIPHGIYQAINHAGNETETISVNGEVIGFQSKYFEKKIDIDQILHSIKVAKKYNPTQTKIIIYTNLSFGNHKPGEKLTANQKKLSEIEKTLNIDIEWNSDKMILDVVAETPWLYRVFFSNTINLERLFRCEEKNTANTFSIISNQICHGTQNVKVDRDDIVEELYNGILQHKHFVIHGEGGSGKTAIVKDLYEKYNSKISFSIRKAHAFKSNSLTEILQCEAIEDFVSIYDTAEYKVFVIDSAEKLQEIEEKEVLVHLLQSLTSAKWTILFTTRDTYLKDLYDDLRRIYHLETSDIPVDLITEEVLDVYSNELGIKLPKQINFKKRLLNLFYLNLYTSVCHEDNNFETYDSFIDAVWRERISGKNTNNGLKLKRQNCFERIVAERMSKGVFYVDASNYDFSALQSLINDEIVAENSRGVFVTHDIYEEWCAWRLINKKWDTKSDVPSFFAELGDSYFVRKEFRTWLSKRIDHDINSVHLLLNYFNDTKIPLLWRDEIIVSILSSKYCQEFFVLSEDILLENNGEKINHIVSLLNLACKCFKEFITIRDTRRPVYIPCGNGWSVIINFIYNHQSKKLEIKDKWKIIWDWCVNNRRGKTTRQCGLMALDELSRYDDYEWYCEGQDTDILNQIICCSALEIQIELKDLIEEITKNRWIKHSSPYIKFSEFIITKPSIARQLIYALSDSVIQLLKVFWVNSDCEKKSPPSIYDHDTNLLFGLNRLPFHVSHDTAWAMQTPVYELLQADYEQALEFIISLTNHSVLFYCNHITTQSYEQLDNIELQLEDGTVTQKGSNSLWALYRGRYSLPIPNILQSVHMALEKWLLENAVQDKKLVFKILDTLLHQSKSVSLTAIVSSVVQANPEIYWKYALVLFKSIELFYYDSIRLQSENIFPMFQINLPYNKEPIEERRSSNSLSFRKNNLETLCVYYQYFRKNLSEEKSQYIIKCIHEIIDTHFEVQKENPCNNTQILLYRLDRRKQSPHASQLEDGIQIELNPQMPINLRNYSEESVAYAKESMHYSFMNTWANLRLNHQPSEAFQNFEESPQIVFDSIMQLYNSVMNGEYYRNYEVYAIFAAAAILIRDFHNKLTEEQFNRCKSLVEQLLDSTLQKDYQFSIQDGVEACVHSLPTLMYLCPQDMGKYIRFLVCLLASEEGAGNYRICDYVTASIKDYSLCEKDMKLFNTILFEYISLSRSIKEYKDNYRSTTSYKHSDFRNRGVTLDHDCIANLYHNNKDHRIHSVQTIILDNHSLENVLNLIPYDTKNQYLEDIVKGLLPSIAESFNSQNNFSYNRALCLYKCFAEFILYRPTTDIENYITPLLSSFKSNDNTKYFIYALYYAANNHEKADPFWKVWRVCLPFFIEQTRTGNEDLIYAFMLSDQWLTDGESEWICFRECDTWFYERMSRECTSSSAMLYSISKVLNGIAKKYIDKGIYWLYNIIEKKPDITYDNKKSETIYYIERVMENFVFLNINTIKTDICLREKVIAILTFISSNESVIGFQLRDRI